MSDQEERELLGAALLAQTGRAQGAPPTDHELADWARRRLRGARLEDVESHLAIRPEVFSRAMRIRQDIAAKRAQPRSRDGLRRWFESFSLAPIAAGVGIIGLAGFAALMLSSNDPAPDDADAGSDRAPVFRSQSLPHPDWRVAAFRAGFVRDATDSGPQGNPIVSIENCLDGDRCASLARSLTDFGAVVSRIAAQCASAGPDAQRRARLGGDLESIQKAMAGSLELSAWQGHLDALTRSIQASQAATCEQSDRLQALLLGD